MKAKSFVAWFFSLTTFLIVLYLCAFYYQLGAQVKAEWWVKDVLTYKTHLAEKMHSPKIIIASGSNSLFGLDSEVVEKITGYPVVNLATHASLQLDFWYYRILDRLDTGDIVVLPLEFKYFAEDKNSEWFINNMLAWGYKDYLVRIPFSELVHFVISVPEERVWRGLLAQTGTNPVLPLEEVLNRAGGSESWKGYGLASLNRRGEILVSNTPTDKLISDIQTGRSYGIENPLVPSKRFLKFYRELSDRVEQIGGRVILTWPVTVRNRLLDFSYPLYQDHIKRIRRDLAMQEIVVFCNPALFNLDLRLFFNTQSHPNLHGAKLRSQNLGACLRKVIDGNYDEQPFDIAIAMTRAQEEEIFRANPLLSRAGRHHVDIVREDFNKLREALASYQSDHGDYPISKGCQGIRFTPGVTAFDWVPGLVPEYLATLPLDPRKLEHKGKQYLYCSNGRDYKLISHLPPDCKSVSESAPELIDPRRDCWAYGYWTSGAAMW